jgi:hypothetical protein
LEVDRLFQRVQRVAVRVEVIQPLLEIEKPCL